MSADLNGVAVLLPQIGHDLGTSSESIGAIVSVAALAFAAPLILVGRVADRVGARRLLLVGVVLFAASATVCAVADSFGVLLVGRALQGVASACAFTTSLAVIDAMFPADRRAFAVGLWGAAAGVGGAIGPLLAGGLAAVWSWRAFFAVNIPFGVFSFVCLLAFVPRSTADRGRDLDLGRLVTLTAAVALVVGGLQNAAPNGWGAAGTIIPLVAGAGLGAVLAMRRRAKGPLVPTRVTRPMPFRVGTWVATAENWGAGVVLVLVPPALQAARDVGVLQTGLLFLSFSVASALTGAASGFLVRTLGARTVLRVGLAVLAVGLAALALLGPAAALGPLLVALAFAGAGNGVVYSVATSYALTDTAVKDAGEASGVLTMARLLGLTLAIALSSSLVVWVDGLDLGFAWAGLRVALALGAVVVAVGTVPLWRGERQAVAASVASAHD